METYGSERCGSLFLNCIKPFPCLESATFFKASEHGARLQFAFPRSPAFREPKNNEPPSPPAPPLQPAKGRRKTSSRLPPNHLTRLDAVSSLLEGTGIFFFFLLLQEVFAACRSKPFIPSFFVGSCVPELQSAAAGKVNLGPMENKMRHWLADGRIFIHSFIHSHSNHVVFVLYKKLSFVHSFMLCA